MAQDTETTVNRLVGELEEAVERYDREAAETICGGLTEALEAAGEGFPGRAAERSLQLLRSKRFFDPMARLASAYLSHPRLRRRARRHHVQALIDQGRLDAAEPELERLRTEAGDDAAARAMALGLTGRARKQRYVDLDEPRDPQAEEALREAVGAYFGAYRDDPSLLWHGINTVACLHRAGEDGVAVEDFPRPREAARQIAATLLESVADKDTERRASCWDFATALEASLALGDVPGAQRWLRRYVASDYADAFELASTLRQLREVWRLAGDGGPGAEILPLIEAELIRREGGELDVGRADTAERALDRLDDAALEARFGHDGLVSYKLLCEARERAKAVALIANGAGEPVGTGFLIDGRSLDERLPAGQLLITNAHVLSDDEGVHARFGNGLGPLHADEAQVSFEALGAAAGRRFGVRELLWSSPPQECDATLALLEEPVPDVDGIPLAPPRLPLPGRSRVYIVGHPGGRSLTYSMQDNLLLDHEGPPSGKPQVEGIVRLHYRAPTEGGSSGSPVFNNQWLLIGLHHAGGMRLQRLNGAQGTYGANQGIWIRSVGERFGG